ncbi:hypothetical protein DRZ77_02070 [Candidatus Woesearchaeota archaeon]|nr:hypothetical protein [Candidatus Woesearchaeota archaeon]RLE40501.1 MAG: hypothetical protein DRZ77_02070 [Candidatus Woesearchaeota archaeon]
MVSIPYSWLRRYSDSNRNSGTTKNKILVLGIPERKVMLFFYLRNILNRIRKAIGFWTKCKNKSNLEHLCERCERIQTYLSEHDDDYFKPRLLEAWRRKLEEEFEKYKNRFKDEQIRNIEHTISLLEAYIIENKERKNFS